MLYKIFKYLISILVYAIIFVILMDYIILPTYVGSSKEYYLPDVRGYFVEKANYKLNKLGFDTEIVTVPYSKQYNPGEVIKMFPRAFTKVKKGRAINLTISGSEKEIIIPNLLTKTLRNAKIEISRLNLGVDTIIYEYDNDMKDGTITFQIPKPGRLVQTSTNMTLGVSKGTAPNYYIVPDLINLSLKKAKNKINMSGLRVGEISFEYQPDLLKITVLDQNMTPGMRVTFPASINLLVTTDSK